MWDLSCQWIPYTMHGTHFLIDKLPPQLKWYCSVELYTFYRTHKPLILAIFSIKNGSHGIIHTFKKYFSTVFLIKYAISKRTLSICLDMDENFHVQRFSIFYFFILGRSVFLRLYVTPMGLVYYL